MESESRVLPDKEIVRRIAQPDSDTKIELDVVVGDTGISAVKEMCIVGYECEPLNVASEALTDGASEQPGLCK